MFRYLIISLIFLSGCGLFEQEQEPLLSTIDGEQFVAIRNGEMNVRKATLFILEGKADSVDYSIQLDILDSLQSPDSLWRKKYIYAINTVLPTINPDDYYIVEQAVFSYFLHYPKEYISFLDEQGSSNIDLWTELMSNALKNATEPKDISEVSVINLALSHCENCSEKDKKLVIQYVKTLQNYSSF